MSSQSFHAWVNLRSHRSANANPEVQPAALSIETTASKSQLFFLLLSIGRKLGARFVSQSLI